MRYRFVHVDGLKIFCREAGADTSPALLLLHGFPTSSHMFRNLIPALADDYRVVAPDLPGFGFSDAPGRAQFKYTFDHLTDVIDRFMTVERLDRYAVYVFDYGALVGFRLATRHPERVTAIISQNGNAYEDGLSEGWNPIQRYWKEPTSENRAALRDFLNPKATKWQYMHGVQDESMIAPESYTLDSALLARPGNDEIQLDLFLDYASNVAPCSSHVGRGLHVITDPFPSHFRPAGAAGRPDRDGNRDGTDEHTPRTIRELSTLGQRHR